MSHIVVELYDALKEAGVSEEKARAAAAAAAVQALAESHDQSWRRSVDSWFAAIEGRLAAIEGQLVFLRWAMTIYATFTTAMLAVILGLLWQT